MRKKIFFMMLLLAGVCLSCSNSDGSGEAYNLPEQVQQTRSVDEPETKLGKAIASVIQNKDKSDNTESFIVYSAEEDECIILTEKEYMLGSLLASMLNNKDSVQTFSNNQLAKTPQKPIKNPWVYAGKASDYWDAIKIGKNIMKKAYKGHNIDIRLIANKDGSYSVYWRHTN